MKSILLLFVLLFSTVTYSADQTIADTDFAPFPLDVIEAMAVIEGVWRGDVVDLKIQGADFSFGGRQFFWITMSNHEIEETRRGVMYYSKKAKRYQLYMIGTTKSIPINMGIFEFSSAYASEAGMACKSGGALLRLQFKIEQVFGEILLTKESCL